MSPHIYCSHRRMTVATLMPQCVEQKHAAQLDSADDLQARSMAKLLNGKLAQAQTCSIMESICAGCLRQCNFASLCATTDVYMMHHTLYTMYTYTFVKLQICASPLLWKQVQTRHTCATSNVTVQHNVTTIRVALALVFFTHMLSSIQES